MGVPLKPSPAFTMIHSQSGPIVVDPTTLSFANYPLAEIVVPGGADTVIFYWTAENTGASDTLIFETIVLDDSRNEYISIGTASALKENVLGSVNARASRLYLRVSGKSTTGTNLRVWASSRVEAVRPFGTPQAAPAPAVMDALAASESLESRAMRTLGIASDSRTLKAVKFASPSLLGAEPGGPALPQTEGLGGTVAIGTPGLASGGIDWECYRLCARTGPFFLLCMARCGVLHPPSGPINPCGTKARLSPCTRDSECRSCECFRNQCL